MLERKSKKIKPLIKMGDEKTLFTLLHPPVPVLHGWEPWNLT
jgi:hypothetical protein